MTAHGAVFTRSPMVSLIFPSVKDKTQTGLYDALQRFDDVEDVGIFEFKPFDVVRNPLITKILQKYEP